MPRLQVSGFHRQNDLLGLAAALVVKVKPPINALVRAFLLFQRTRPNQTQCPPLELIRIVARKFLRPEDQQARR